MLSILSFLRAEKKTGVLELLSSLQNTEVRHSNLQLKVQFPTATLKEGRQIFE